MFKIPKGTPVTSEIIRKAVEYNEKDVAFLNDLDDNYQGDESILNRKKADRFKNNIVIVNHAEYITDLKTGYLLGNPITYSLKEKAGNVDINPILELYEEQDIHTFDNELGTEVSKFGSYYERTYLDGNKPRSSLLDGRNCILIYDNTVKRAKVGAVVYEIADKSKKDWEFNELLYIDNLNVYDYRSPKGTISVSPVSIEAHNLTYVPVIEYPNNRKMTGDYQKVLPLIKAYNILASDRINNVEQLVETILIIKGMKFEDGMSSSLKENRIMANIPKDGAVEFLTKELNEDQLHILKKDIEDDIFKISKTPNMTDENFLGNSSGVALKYKLLPFEIATNTKEAYFKKGLRERFVIYNTYLNKKDGMPLVAPHLLNIIFKRSLPQNDFETSQMIANLDGHVSEVTLVKQLSFVDNAEDEVKQAQKEQDEKMKNEASNFSTDNMASGDQKETSFSNSDSTVEDDTDNSDVIASK